MSQSKKQVKLRAELRQEIENQKHVSAIRAERFAKTGWITGIISVSTCWTGFVGLILGILSIVFSAIAEKQGPLNKKWRVNAEKGLKMGIAGTAVSVAFIILWAIVFAYIAWKYIIW